MTIFGIDIPIWSIVVTVVFAVIYVVFTILDKRRIKKQKAKRQVSKVKNNGNDI